MKFSQVDTMRIPKGAVARIRSKGSTMWEKYPIRARYVSLGDSIAAGHTINDDWETDYGYGSQYGENGNTETQIVPGCYTDLIRQEMSTIYGGGRVDAISFARSGDTVADLVAKLDHEAVKVAIKKADYVTVCIGANDVLQPALSHLDEYINTGDMSTISAIVDANLAALADDNNPNSYTALFRKLVAINPNAKYVFTTIYNPYKYLWIDEGENGFFAPLINSIPVASGAIADWILDDATVQLLYARVNGLPTWAEANVTKLNTVLRNKISAFGNANFMLTDTKTLFEAFPDRPVAAEKHYNDLISVEYTRGYDVYQMDWGRLWEGSNATSYWINLWSKHDGNQDAIMADFVEQAINKVIIPDIDPHPEEYGHYVIMRSFADAFGWKQLDRYAITYHANGGTGTMPTQEVTSVDNLPAYTSLTNAFGIPAEGYYLSNWVDNGGATYTNGQIVGVTGDLVLTAQWSNMYVVAWRKVSNNEYVSPSGETGPVTKNDVEYYLRATLGGTVLSGLRDKFSSDGKTEMHAVQVPYGTELYIQLINTGSADRGAVYLNGNKVAGNLEYCYYTMPIKKHTAIEFTWEQEGVIIDVQSYWIAYMTEYAELPTN